MDGEFVNSEQEITAGHRPFSDQNDKMTDQIPICLDMIPIGFLLCPSKSYHARTECPTKTQSLFLALLFIQVSGKFTTLDVILEDSEVDCFGVISKCVPASQWANISEEKSQLMHQLLCEQVVLETL